MSTTTEYTVTGMTCGHCAMSVKEEVGQVAGIEDVAVSVADGRMVVTAPGPVDDALVVAAVQEAGYRAARA